MLVANLLTVVLTLTLAACAAARGPVIGKGTQAGDVGGTISGIARTSEGEVPLVARKVTAIEVSTGAKYESSTASNGGYTMKVPKGRYRLELELRPGESLVRQPEETQIDTSDMDAGRDFLVTVKPPPTSGEPKPAQSLLRRAARASPQPVNPTLTSSSPATVNARSNSWPAAANACRRSAPLDARRRAARAPDGSNETRPGTS
jgi:hypothetical protein